MVTPDELRQTIADHSEWLLVRDSGRSFPLLSGEVEVSEHGKKHHFGFLDDGGFQVWRLNSAAMNGAEIALDVSGIFGRGRETMRLVPRTAAAELSAEVARARLEKANEIARFIKLNFAGVKIGRVALNDDNGRLAQIEFETADKIVTAAIADLTAKVTPEVLLTTALTWLERIGQRKNKAARDLWIIAEKRQAKAAQKLLALLNEYWKGKIATYEIDRRLDPPVLKLLTTRRMGDLWREKAPKLLLPASRQLSSMAGRIADLAPNEIDVVFSRQGETLRFNGLPFARVRSLMGAEKAWFGVARDRRLLTDNWDQLHDFLAELKRNRWYEPSGKRHVQYKASPEAWLESILRRNIHLLDANLVLSPIYNQFRSSNDKIDLLALRRDGRLVIIELKTQPDRAGIFQAADYWRKIELQRRRGILAAANLFEGREIADKPALVYFAAPAWSFHRDFEFFARALSPEIELWRFELHENWRERVRVLARQRY